MKYFHLHYNLHGWRSERNLLECVEICRENIITMCLRLLKTWPITKMSALILIRFKKVDPYGISSVTYYQSKRPKH